MFAFNVSQFCSRLTKIRMKLHLLFVVSYASTNFVKLYEMHFKCDIFFFGMILQEHIIK